MLLVALAAPALGQVGPTKLFDPSVSPRSATFGAGITFAVSYRNPEGSDPAYVRVVVAGTAHALARSGSGGTVHDGLRYAGSFVLPVGTWSVTFDAADTRTAQFTTQLDAGSVTIAAPPRPSPTPKPTPAPTSTPRATPAATSGPGSKPTSTPSGVPQPSIDPSAAPAPTPTPTALETLAASPSPSPTPDPLTAGAGTIGQGPASGGSGPSGETGGSRGDDHPFGPSVASAGLPPILGGSSLSPMQRVLSSALTTATGVTVVMSFAFFGKRRRDNDPTAPDEVLEASAAEGGDPAAADLVPATIALDGDLAMPRWRRPSLLEARRADPSRTAPTQFNLTFDHGFVAPVAGLERRRIRYRVVRLLDGPDELLATEIGFLDEGDEVQLVERTGSFWKVLCPDGRSGWVHRMVLGDIVGSADEEAEPSDIDEDVLAAFLASRAEAS